MVPVHIRSRPPLTLRPNKLLGRQNKNMNLIAQINSSALEFNFPMLDNGYVYYGNSRINVMINDDGWALAIQVWGFHSRAGEDGLYTGLYIYGNKIGNEIGFTNDRIIYPLNISGSQIINDDESLNIEIDKVELRNIAVNVPKDKNEYKSFGIMIEDRIMFYDFMRIMGAKYKDQVMATPNEIQSLIGFIPTQEKQIDTWIHPDVVNNEIPGDAAVFQMINNAILYGDLSTIVPIGDNTHFSNWPESGLL